jgi:hypothetical protein
VQGEAGHRHEGNPDLSKFEAARDQRLVVAVGDLSPKRRQEKEWRDENAAGERDQRLGVGSTDLEQDEKNERGLEEVVAESREELAPEQGREAPRQHQ